MKLSAIMVSPTIPLADLPRQERETLSRVLFQCFQGLDEAHNRRWRRLWRRIFEGASLHFYPVVERSGAYHRRHMAIEGAIFDHQDGFYSREAFRQWLKTGAAFGRFVATDAGLVFEPASVSYDQCSDDQMREFHEAALEFLHTDHALATLWPAMAPKQRAEALELVLDLERQTANPPATTERHS